MKLIKMYWSLQHSQHKVAGIGMTQPAHLSHGTCSEWLVVTAASMDLAVSHIAYVGTKNCLCQPPQACSRSGGDDESF